MKIIHKHIARSTYAGIASGILMVLFFLVSRILNWHFMWMLHYVNILFLIPAIYYSVYHISDHNAGDKYFKGLAAGMSATVKGGIFFSFFLLLYLRFIEPAYMEHIHRTAPLGHYMNPLLVALVLLTEQVCAGIIITLVTMQFFKNT